MKQFFASTLLIASMSAIAVSPNDIKQPESYGNTFVSDAANIISANNERELDDALSKYHEVTGVQVAVVTTKDTKGSDSPRTFANKVFESFELGDPELDNGLLILLSVNDKRIEFETGYGLEGLLPDVTQYRIQQEFMIPSFKQGDYEQGLLDGTYATMIEIDRAAKIEAGYVSNNHPPPNTLSLLGEGDTPPTAVPLTKRGDNNLLFVFFGLMGLGAIGLFAVFGMSRIGSRSEKELEEKSRLIKALTDSLSHTSNSPVIATNQPCDYCHELTIDTLSSHGLLATTPSREALHLSPYEKSLIDRGFATVTFKECSDCQQTNKVLVVSKTLNRCGNCSEVSQYLFSTDVFMLASYINIYVDVINQDRTKPLQTKLFKSVQVGWQHNAHTNLDICHCFTCDNLKEYTKHDRVPNVPVPPKPKPALEPRHVAAPINQHRTSATSSSSAPKSSSASWGISSSNKGFGSRSSSSSRSSGSSRSRSSSSSSRPKSKPRSRGGKSGGGGAGSSW